MYMDDEKLHEECGVFGIFSKTKTEVAGAAYYALYALQHRGQESAGIVVNDDGIFNDYKDLGLVNEVFTPEILAKLGEGNMAVGHCNYGTTSGNNRANAQPIVVNHMKGRMALANNGCLVNAKQLRETLELEGSIFHTTSDAELISTIIIKERLACGSIEEAVNRAMCHLEGAYSMVIMSPAKMLACRDELGMRPLCYGQCEDESYVIASESCALDAVGAKFIRDIEPGEIVLFDKDGVHSLRDHCEKREPRMCVFEYIYFARPDSVINGVTVHDARVQAGKFLAQEHPIDADIVIGVPDSGLDAALGYSMESGIPYEIGFLKNKYIGRTFIVPGQKARENKVRIKLNPIASVIRGKRVVVVDDSIVRGTTSARIVKTLREAGAKEVHMMISSPPFINTCYYGTDIDEQDNLVACNHSLEEITQMLDVDSVHYLSVENARMLTGKDTGFCCGCFTSEYPTEVPKEKNYYRFQKKLSEVGKTK